MTGVIDWLIQVYILLIVLRAFLSWGFVPVHHRVYRWLVQVTEPLLAPIRRLIHRSRYVTGIDFSPAIAIVLLVLLRQWLHRLF